MSAAPLEVLPLRIAPGEDLRGALEDAFAARGMTAVFVISGIGSLSQAAVRTAGAQDSRMLEGPLEIVSLAGTLSRDGAHLHASVADAQGRVVGGHVGRGCVVRTTAEVLLAQLPQWSLTREHDARTGFAELVANRIDED